MYLTIDAGNSNIVTIVYDENRKIVFKDRLASLRERDKSYYAEYYQHLLDNLIGTIEITVLSSVVPNITDMLVELLTDLFQCPVINVNTDTVDIRADLDNPRELGADFIAGAVAAVAQYHQPTIIIDMGTANKISVIDKPLTILGGIIQPGIEEMAEILHQHIPHLPKIELVVPKKYMGSNTMECIQSGIMHGALLSLIGLAKEVEKEVGRPCQTVLTGGYINLYKDLHGYEYNPDLINEGLLEIALKEYSNGKPE